MHSSRGSASLAAKQGLNRRDGPALHAQDFAAARAICGENRHFVDTIKLIACRVETALVQLARENLTRADDARALVRQLFASAADLWPDAEHKTLTVRLHRLSSGIHDAALEHPCADLTATETVFPGTELRLIYEPVGITPIPRDQES